MPDWSERGHVLATCDKQFVYCRVVGVGNMNNCAAFQTYSQQMRERGYREFILDFSKCEGLDSTFLGILLGIALGDRRTPAHVVVLNANQTILRILGEVGIDRLLEVCPEKVELPEIPLQRLQEQQRGRDRIAMILRAHEDLCELDSDNHQRFGRFLTALKKELAEQDDDDDTTAG